VPSNQAQRLRDRLDRPEVRARSHDHLRPRPDAGAGLPRRDVVRRWRDAPGASRRSRRS
jgi:hypothetical protein